MGRWESADEAREEIRKSLRASCRFWPGYTGSTRLLPNERHIYGSRRGSILASFIHVVTLLVVMGSLGWESLHRLQTQVPIPPTWLN